MSETFINCLIENKANAFNINSSHELGQKTKILNDKTADKHYDHCVCDLHFIIDCYFILI